MRKPIIQFTRDGAVVGEWISAGDTEKVTGFDSSSITKCCKGVLKTAYSFVWRYKGEDFNKYPCVNNSSKEIIQYTLDGTIVQKWRSIRQASIATGVSRSSIFRSCNMQKQPNCEYVWRYAI